MMKKLLFLGLAFSASVGMTNAQNARLKASQLGPKASINAVLNGDAYHGNGSNATANPGNQKVNIRGTFGTKIGKTFYDLPTNASVPNRTLRHPDGTISAVWTETCTGSQSPSFATRGVGYNYYNGSNWTEGPTGDQFEFNGTCAYPKAQADFGIASKRVGWPEIISIGGNEMVFTHDVGISVTKRPTKGTGGMAAWSATTDLAFTQNIGGVSGNNGTWPRVVSNGNNIHMIYSVNNTPVPVIDGVSGMMVYSRSTDGGNTWDKQNVKLPGLNSTNGYTRMGGDSYAIAVKGNNVAIIAGYFGQPWTMWKSTNNGDTWTRTVMKALVPADTINNTFISSGDTIRLAATNDNGHAVVIDNNGAVHAFAGQLVIQVKDTLGTVLPGDSYYPNSGRALYHWTDKTPTTEPEIIAEIEPANATSGRPNWIASGASGGVTQGRTPYGTMGMVSMANAAIDASNNVYLVYAGVVRGTSHLGTDSTGQPYRDLYYKKLTGTTWGPSINIGRELSTYSDKSTPAENSEESVFPSVHHFVDTDGFLHVTWMSDFLPGMNLGADADPEGENSIMYAAINTNNIKATGVKKDIAAFVNEIKAYPNPTNGKVAINVDLKKAANVTVRVTNIMGQEISTVKAGKLATGQNTVSVDMSNYANGIYLYTVSSDDFTVTNRIVKQ